MNRPWKTWLVFGVCLAVLLAAMGWVSLAALRLDRAQAQAEQQAELEERVRLALWRMDSMLAPIIAQESARPYFVYRPFYAAERTYNKMFNSIETGEVLVPSPLLTHVSSNVLLHFQFGPDGQFTSPQVPTGNERDLAETSYTTGARIDAAAARLQQFEQLMRQQAAPELAKLARSPGASKLALDRSNFAARNPKSVPQSSSAKAPAVLDNGDVLFAVTPPPIFPNVLTNVGQGWMGNRANAQRSAPSPQPAQQKLFSQQDVAQQQAGRNEFELQARAQSVQQAYDLNAINAAANFAPAPRVTVLEGVAKPVWFGEALVVARRASVHGEEYLQGCWFNWPVLRAWLLEGVKDLLPAAALQPMAGNGDDPQARLLASLPVRLIPGFTRPSSAPLVSPILFALLLAWGCMLLAALAVAVLLHGAVSLSERRGAFVSAVTHELRTPLTTFKMYSEMLADDMVPDATQRKSYLQTLCSEANRLSHLVENVLAYARLERGSARRRVEPLPLGEMITRVKPRLEERAARAGMTLVEDADPLAAATVVHVDVSAVEQILFNLVDNACKYAAPAATEKVIHLELLPETGRFAMLRVRDHGQGISAEGAKKLFKPFSKSANEAAHTAPGVGLGLALCRRLSRSMGGN